MEFNSHRILTNTAWNFTSYIWPILFAIFITPLVVHSMGIKIYGVYAFINTIISFMGLLDLGLSTAVSKYLAEYNGQNDADKIRKLVGTTTILFTTIGLIGCAIFIAGSFIPYTQSLFEAYRQYQVGIIFAGIMFFITALNSLNSISFTALQRFDISSKLGIVTLTIQQLSILIIILTGHSINAIFITLTIISLIQFFVSRYFSSKILPEIHSYFSWDSSEFKKYYKFGLVTFVNNIATVSLSYLDRMIIPFFLGPASLTYYSLPGNITTRVPGVSNSLASILFPMASSLSGAGDIEKIKKLYVRSFRLITVISAAIVVTVISFAHQILAIWISPDLADKATTVLIILTITNFILAMGGPLSNFLLGLGKLKFLTTLSIVMAAINTILLVILLPISGITGAAWAYLISVLPIAYMFYYTEKYYLNLGERKKYYRETVLGNATVSIIVFFIAHYLLLGYINNLFTLLTLSALTGIIYISLYWLFGFFEKEDVESIKMFAGRIITMQ